MKLDNFILTFVEYTVNSPPVGHAFSPCAAKPHVLKTQCAFFRYGFFFSKNLLLFSTEKKFFRFFFLITFFFLKGIYFIFATEKKFFSLRFFSSNDLLHFFDRKKFFSFFFTLKDSRIFSIFFSKFCFVLKKWPNPAVKPLCISFSFPPFVVVGAPTFVWKQWRMS